MSNQREIQNILYKMMLESSKKELDSLKPMERENAKANMKSRARVSARKMIDEDNKEYNKKLAQREEKTPEGVVWKQKNACIDGYYNDKLLFEIKRGPLVFSLYENKQYIGCSTQIKNLKERALKMFRKIP